MSGIYGFYVNAVGTKRINLDLQRIKRWNHAYGKEKQVSFQEGNISLGCCLDNVKEQSICENPLLVRGEKVYVVDVLLYNPEELVERLEIYSILSDEELFVEYLERFGFEALATVNGDFAGAVINRATNKVTLFRDHMGVRPLYYYQNEGFVAFSSDIRGLVSLPEVDASVNEAWLYKTIGGYSTLHPTETEFANIFAVQPASYMEFHFDEHGVKPEIKKYWTLGQKKIRRETEAEYQSKLRELITDSVRRRLQAVSGPVGAELSGGLDSSVIDILIHREGRECVYFSWSYSPEELPLVEADERYIIRDICEQEGIQCHYAKRDTKLGPDSNIAKNMGETGLETPEEWDEVFRYVLPPTINTLQICESSQFVNRAGAKVIFSGHGGDEGVSHRSRNYELFYHKEYLHYFKQMWSLKKGKRLRLARTLKSGCEDILGAGREGRGSFQSYRSVPELMSEELRKKFSEKEMPALTFGFDPIHYIKSGGSRNRLEVTALLGAYCNVRYLFPYLDYRVIDYAVSIPRWLYLHGTQNRFIFREAFKDIMPDSLYRLQCKVETSKANLKENNQQEKYQERNGLIQKALSKELWEKYLDFGLAEQCLRQNEESTDEERRKAENVQYDLLMCAVFENVVKRCRGE